jgi:hypothetical protein
MITTNGRNRLGSTRTRAHSVGPGVAWPDTGSTTESSHVKSAFGWRIFNSHIPTLGHDNDFHRGVDVDMELNDPVYSLIAGAVTRVERYDWLFTQAADLDDFDQADETGHTISVDTGALQIEHDASATTFGTTIDCPRVHQTVGVNGDVEIRAEIDPQSMADGDEVGIYLKDATDAAKWITAYHTQASSTEQVGSADRNGSGDTVSRTEATAAHESNTWLRIDWDQSTGGYTAYRSDDGDEWTTIATGTVGAANKPVIGVYVASAGAAVTGRVAWWAYEDADKIGRFGNWMMLAGMSPLAPSEPIRAIVLHCGELQVGLGDVVEVGQQIATAHRTGWDYVSGTVLYPHPHIEFLPYDDTSSNQALYSNDVSINPLTPGLLPRADVNDNITVSVTEADDPDDVASWRYSITFARRDEDFDLGKLEFVEGETTKTVNLNTRDGLDPTDSDEPSYDGVYFDPQSDTSLTASEDWSVDIYVHQTEFAAAPELTVYDGAGTVLVESSRVRFSRARYRYGHTYP